MSANTVFKENCIFCPTDGPEANISALFFTAQVVTSGRNGKIFFATFLSVFELWPLKNIRSVFFFQLSASAQNEKPFFEIAYV